MLALEFPTKLHFHMTYRHLMVPAALCGAPHPVTVCKNKWTSMAWGGKKVWKDSLLWKTPDQKWFRNWEKPSLKWFHWLQRNTGGPALHPSDGSLLWWKSCLRFDRITWDGQCLPLIVTDEKRVGVLFCFQLCTETYSLIDNSLWVRRCPACVNQFNCCVGEWLIAYGSQLSDTPQFSFYTHSRNLWHI